MEKSEDNGFFRNYCSLWYQSWLIKPTKSVHESLWVPKFKVNHWPWSRSLGFNNFKLLFLNNRLVDWSQISCGASTGWRNRSEFKCLGKVKTMDFSETIVVYDIKCGRWSQLNKYMKLYEYQCSRPFIELGPSHSDSIFSNFFSSITARQIEAKFHVAIPRDWGMEVSSNGF